MANAFFLIIFVLSSFCLCAQDVIFESFDENDFQTQWFGDVQAFVPEQNLLRLRAPENQSRVRLIKPLVSEKSTCWSGEISLGFDPSPSNFLQMYLLTDSRFQNAWWFQVGGASGKVDEITFYERKAGRDSVLFATPVGSVATRPSFHYQICQKSDSLIARFVIEKDTLNYRVAAVSNIEAGYFVIQPKYTSSRADLFYFDNIAISSIKPDTIKPELQAVTIFQDSICFEFSEWLSLFSLEVVNEKGLFNRICLPSTSNQNIQMNLEMVDLEGNTQRYYLDTVIQFPEEPENPNSLWISEVMADPSPAVALPEEEYVELYNPNDFPVSLESVSLHIGDRAVSLSGILPSFEHLLVVDEEAAGRYQAKNILAVSLPAIRNTGQDIWLAYQDTTIFAMRFDQSTYADNSKDDGGYSLELQSYSIECTGTVYRASAWPQGGSPGSRNKEVELIQVVAVEGTDTLQVKVDFPVRSVEALVDGNWFELVYENNKTFVSPIQDLASGDVILVEAIRMHTCTATTIDTIFQKRLGIANRPIRDMLLISEVHAAPDGRSEFIELHNRTNDFLDISGLAFTKEEDMCSHFITINFIGPGETLVFTKTPESWRIHPNIDTSGVIEQAIPALNNDGTTLYLWDCLEDKELDNFSYSDNNSLWKGDEKGFSLERNLQNGQIYLNNAEPLNASPTYIPPIAETQLFELSNELLIPEDPDPAYGAIEITISNMDKEAQIIGHLYTEEGKLIGNIFEPFVLGPNRVKRIWDGRINGQYPENAMYLVHLQLISASGFRTIHKESITIQR